MDVREERKRLAQELEDVAHLNTPYGYLGKRMDIDGVDVAYICPHAFLWILISRVEIFARFLWQCLGSRPNSGAGHFIGKL